MTVQQPIRRPDPHARLRDQLAAIREDTTYPPWRDALALAMIHLSPSVDRLPTTYNDAVNELWHSALDILQQAHEHTGDANVAAGVLFSQIDAITQSVEAYRIMCVAESIPPLLEDWEPESRERHAV